MNTLPDNLVALMLSISTLQIQSVKNVIENNRTLPQNKHNKGKNNEIRNEMPPCWLQS